MTDDEAKRLAKIRAEIPKLIQPEPQLVWLLDLIAKRDARIDDAQDIIDGIASHSGMRTEFGRELYSVYNDSPGAVARDYRTARITKLEEGLQVIAKRDCSHGCCCTLDAEEALKP